MYLKDWRHLENRLKKKIDKGKVRTSKAEMKQFASHSEEDITAKRQNIVHIKQSCSEFIDILFEGERHRNKL
jgi:flagellar biosynthesis chaperone FliJ